MTALKIKKENQKKLQLCIAIIMNLSVVILSAIGTAIRFKISGFGMFQLYTVDSNILAMLACTVYAFFLIYKLIKQKEPPLFAIMAKYISVCCLMVTFVVVITVLAPINGLKGYKFFLLNNDMLYHHLLCPTISFLSFILFDHVPLKAPKAALFVLAPTIIYAVVTVTLNITKKLVGPYPFLKVYNQPVYMSVVWFIIILGGTYTLALLIAKLRHNQ